MTFLDTGDPVHFNRFAYANNDPINMLDPFGLQACDGVKGGCLEAKNFKPAKDGTDTVVAPQDVIDAGLKVAPSLQGKTEQGTALNRGTDGTVSGGNASTGTKNKTGQETAMKVNSTTEAVIHSHPNTSDFNVAPGYESKTKGDHTAVEKGFPNMITRKGTTVVVEKVNGQFRVRTVQGKMTRTERNTTKDRLRKFQKAGR